MKIKTNALLLTIVLVGCISVIGCWYGIPTFSKSYVQEYILYDGIKVRRAITHSTKYLDLYVNITRRVNFLSKGEDKKMYDKICEMYGDTEYNQEVFLIAEGVPMVSVEYPACAAIEVVSTRDFDAEHPAGTSLTDIMSVKYQSAAGYIESGYTDLEDLFEWKVRPLNELQPQDLALSVHNIFLIFDKEPDVLEQHALSIKWTSAEGNTYTTTYNYDFSLPEGRVEPWTEVTYDTIYNPYIDNNKVFR